MVLIPQLREETLYLRPFQIVFAHGPFAVKFPIGAVNWAIIGGLSADYTLDFEPDYQTKSGKIGVRLTGLEKNMYFARLPLRLSLFPFGDIHSTWRGMPNRPSPTPPMPPTLRRSTRAKRLLRCYTQHSKDKATFLKMCRERRQQIQPHPRRSLHDDLQSMSSDVKLLSDNVSDLLQMESLDVELSGISSDPSSSENSSDGISSEDISDGDLNWISEDDSADEDTSMSDISSDEDGALSDDELDTTDDDDNSDTESTPPTSFHVQVFDELKQMYAHRYEIPRKRLPKPNSSFLKYLLETLRDIRPDHFRAELHISPHIFDRLVEAIASDPVFTGHSTRSYRQAPVQEQLAVALYRFGHNGNAAGLQSIANWAGIGKGTVRLYTHRVMVALLRPEFMKNTVYWPDEEEKETAKEWVQDHSCKAWRNGWCFVDGTLIPLATRPYWYGESYFDRKCRYSLNVQVCFQFSHSDQWCF